MNVIDMIESQQKGHENSPRYMIGEQLKEIAMSEPVNAELIEKDLLLTEMSLEAAEKMLQNYADKNRNGATVFCITPLVADRLLREFYGLNKMSIPEKAKAEESDGYIDLAEFL